MTSIERTKICQKIDTRLSQAASDVQAVQDDLNSFAPFSGDRLSEEINTAYLDAAIRNLVEVRELVRED